MDERGARHCGIVGHIDRVDSAMACRLVRLGPPGEAGAILVERPRHDFAFAQALDMRRWEKCLPHVRRVAGRVAHQIVIQRDANRIFVGFQREGHGNTQRERAQGQQQMPSHRKIMAQR